MAVERMAAARSAIDALDPTVMLVGRNENFRVPDMLASESIARAVAYAEAGADCLFVPFLLDSGAVAELVAAVAPKPVNVVVHDYDDRISRLAARGSRRATLQRRRKLGASNMGCLRCRSPVAPRPRNCGDSANAVAP